MLFVVLISFILGFIDGLLGTVYTFETSTAAMETTEVVVGSVGILQTIFTFVVLLPNIAVSIRRLHDYGKSGWWFLLSVIPFVNLIGIFVLLYFYVQDSQPGENQYGPNPKEQGLEELTETVVESE
jgi:uncharacterized membrane protein YhaH (DUF805 family)